MHRNYSREDTHSKNYSGEDSGRRNYSVEDVKPQKLFRRGCVWNNYSLEDDINNSLDYSTHKERVYFVVEKGNKEREKEVVGGGGSDATIGEVVGGDANGSRDIRVVVNIKLRLSGKKVLEGRGLMQNSN